MKQEWNACCKIVKSTWRKFGLVKVSGAILSNVTYQRTRMLFLFPTAEKLENFSTHRHPKLTVCVNPIRSGLFWGVWAPGGGGGGRGGRKVPAALNSKTIPGIEIKFGRVVENHRLISLVKFNLK